MQVAALQLTRVKIQAFDEFFDKFEAQANKVIGFNNTLAGAILDVKLAAGALMGGFHVKLSPDTDHDSVLLEFAKADGTLPASDEVALLLLKPEVKAADGKLAAARAKLLASTPCGLTAAPAGLAHPEEYADVLKGFNEALAAFKTIVGSGYIVKVVLKPAASKGAPTVVVALSKPVFEDDAEQPTYQPATLLDVAAARAAKDIYAAQIGVAEQVHALARSAKDLSISFHVKGGRVQVPSEVDDEARLATIAKNVANFNTQCYKLVHSAVNAGGEVNLAGAVVAVVKALRTQAAEAAKTAGKDALAAVPTVVPKIESKEDGTFELSLDIKYEEPDISPPAFPEGLPGRARYVWQLLLSLKSTAAELLSQLGLLKDDLQKLLDSTQDLFSDVSASASDAGLEMTDALAVPARMRDNMQGLTGVSAVGPGILSLMKAVVEDLAASVEEVKKLAA